MLLPRGHWLWRAMEAVQLRCRGPRGHGRRARERRLREVPSALPGDASGGGREVGQPVRRVVPGMRAGPRSARDPRSVVRVLCSRACVRAGEPMCCGPPCSGSRNYAALQPRLRVSRPLVALLHHPLAPLAREPRGPVLGEHRGPGLVDLSARCRQALVARADRGVHGVQAAVEAAVDPQPGGPQRLLQRVPDGADDRRAGARARRLRRLVLRAEPNGAVGVEDLEGRLAAREAGEIEELHGVGGAEGGGRRQSALGCDQPCHLLQLLGIEVFGRHQLRTRQPLLEHAHFEQPDARCPKLQLGHRVRRERVRLTRLLEIRTAFLLVLVLKHHH
mmetsp:Transcript_29086/g.90665  ORF Transcript_29086/g.90665 Transcript_29086/m.90665 type:complete len:333 (+) Transcript_29086:352-1350(+)